jgi:TPR repeat protein
VSYKLVNKILLILRFRFANLLVFIVFLPWVVSGIAPASAQSDPGNQLANYAKDLAETAPQHIQSRLRDAHLEDVGAMYEMAIYLRTLARKTDDPINQLAFGWALNAARRGHPEAAQLTGEMYRKGVGVGQDYSRARKWLERALARRSTEPNFELALLYSDEANLGYDSTKAASYLAAAIRASEPRACLISARNKMQDGTAFQIVIEDITCAADGGLVEAMEMLGDYHLTQRSPYANRRARHWFQRAMQAGSQTASEKLASLISE